ADTGIADSDFARTQALKHEIAPQKMRVVYDPADPEYFCPDAFDKLQMRRKHNLPLTGKIALMIARFAPNKRHDVMLAAGGLLRPSLDSFHLVLKGELYGPSDEYDRVRGQVDAMGLSDRVTFFGFVPDIRELQAAADVLVLCSDREALGRCVVEAMSMRRPVVVTNSGGTHEVVEEGKTGFVVPGGDADALAARLREVLTNPALAEKMGRAGRDFVIHSSLSAKNSARAVMEVYDQLIRARAHPRLI
ncbi:MAG: glycosyltransferase family 4 protein, partial [Acidobacteriota bacterium]|nr:glycosyltransferase family 4 protein [Acidobacteriota bacterium]